jgi:hypothetical protein
MPYTRLCTMKPKLKKRYLVPAVLCLLFYLNLQFQWHRDRIYINLLPPVSYLGMGNGYFGPHERSIGIHDEDYVFGRTYRLDRTDPFLLTADSVRYISACGPLFCRVLAASYGYWSQPTNCDWVAPDKCRPFSVVAGAVVLHQREGPNIVKGWGGVLGQPQLKPWNTPSELVVFEPGGPALVILGRPEATPSPARIRRLVLAACARQGISDCPIPPIVD